VGPYIVDFYCPQKKLAIELDGGGHAEEFQAEYDKDRTSFLLESGIEVLRFWNHQVFQETDAVMQEIWNALQR